VVVDRLRRAACAALWPHRWNDRVKLPIAFASRVLYQNPVCLLSTTSLDRPPKRNVMTVSWLTAIDNKGGFVMALNRRRASAERIVHAFKESDVPLFTLGVAVAGMETLLLQIGGCSGRDVDKATAINGWSYCVPGWREADSSSTTTTLKPSCRSERDKLENAIAGQRAVAESVAHLVAQIVDVRELENGHILVFAKSVRVFVRPGYWRDETLKKKGERSSSKVDWKSSAVFGPRAADSFSLPPPPILTFLGSKVFGSVSGHRRYG